MEHRVKRVDGGVAPRLGDGVHGAAMNTAERIEHALTEALHPERLRIDDESHLHAGHAGAAGGGGHYRVSITAAAFAGKGLLERHRMVYAALAGEMKSAIHALALDTRAPGE